MIQPHTINANTHIRHHLKFDDSDLKANHEGALSARQTRTLWHKMNGTFRTFGLCFTMVTFMLWEVSVIPRDTYTLQAQCVYAVFGLIIAAGFMVGGVYLVFEAQRTLYRDICSGQVMSYKGAVDVHPPRMREDIGSGAFITITTDKKEIVRIWLPSQVQELMVPRYVYHLYYTPHSKTLIALEPVPEDSPHTKQLILAKPPRLPRTTRRERRQTQQNAK